jgi:sentrin-specific protease 8
MEILLVTGSDLVEIITNLGIHEARISIFPINNNESSNVGGSHWSLGVFDRLNQVFVHIDSHKDANEGVAKKLLAKLQAALSMQANQPQANTTFVNDHHDENKQALTDASIDAVSEIQFFKLVGPQQQNNFDCGAFVVSFAEFVGVYLNCSQIPQSSSFLICEEFKSGLTEFIKINPPSDKRKWIKNTIISLSSNFSQC